MLLNAFSLDRTSRSSNFFNYLYTIYVFPRQYLSTDRVKKYADTLFCVYIADSIRISVTLARLLKKYQIYRLQNLSVKVI
jgi:hypothetical protein